jgi:hypothetical protein
VSVGFDGLAIRGNYTIDPIFRMCAEGSLRLAVCKLYDQAD